MYRAPILAEERWPRLLVLCGLYVAQGVPHGFVTITLAAAITASMKTGDATDLEIASATSKIIFFSTLPWMFKWIAGPFVDRFSIPGLGRRRPWIILAQLGMMLTLVQMAMLPDPVAQLTSLAWLAFAHSVFNALQDVSVDALAVDLLPPKERGRVTGLMYGSKFVGTAIGGAGLSFVAARTDLTGAFVAMILVILAISLLPLLTIERRGEHLLIPGGEQSPTNEAENKNLLNIFKKVAAAFSTRPALATAALCVMATAANGMLVPIGTILFVNDLEWGQEQYGRITGGIAVFAGLFGAIAGGFLADWFGPRKVAAISTVFYGLLLSGFGLAETLWTNENITVPYIVAEAFFLGCLSTSIFAICLGVSHAAIAATQFTAYMAMLNLSTIWGTAISPKALEYLGTAGAFVAAGIMQAAIVCILPFTQVRAQKQHAD